MTNRTSQCSPPVPDDDKGPVDPKISESRRRAQQRSVVSRRNNKLMRKMAYERVEDLTTLRLQTTEYTPSDKQKEFGDLIAQGKHVVLFVGGIRSGKTWAGAFEAVKQIYVYHRMPPMGWIVAPTYKMCNTAAERFAAAAGPAIMKYMRSDKEFILRPHEGSNGYPFRVQIRSAELPDNLRGLSCSFIWADEAAMMTEECYNILRGRTMDCGGVLFMTTTPRNPDWLWEKVWLKQGTDKTIGCVKIKTDENPFLPYTEVVEFRSTYPELFAQRELDAEFVRFEGLVYRNFDPIRHTLGEVHVEKSDDLVVGVDPGHADPFAVVWIAKKDGKFIVVDDYYERWKTPDNVIGYIKGHPYFSMFRPRIWIDPSAAGVIAEFQKAGMPAFAALRSDLKEGIHHVNRLVENGQLYVAKKAEHTLREFGQYAYPNREGHNIDDKPVDFSNHCMDAMRYALTSEWGFSAVQPAVINDGETFEIIKGDKHDLDRDYAATWYADENNARQFDACEQGFVLPDEDY